MISSNDLRPGITIELDGSVWQCVEFLHVTGERCGICTCKAEEHGKWFGC